MEGVNKINKKVDFFYFSFTEINDIHSFKMI